MDAFFQLEEMSESRRGDMKDPANNAIELEGIYDWGAAPEMDDGAEVNKVVKNCHQEVPQEVAYSDIKTEEASTKPSFKLCISPPLHVKKGEILAVVGKVGSGKSSLIAACLGELEFAKDPAAGGGGGLGLNGSVGLAAQIPWILNSTLRDNIIMEREYDKERYEHVLSTCALNDDIEMLPAGSSTEIGEKGITLSGGQKARVSLARALYADPDIYMLDDPLSAVDAHVGRHLFDFAIKKEMSSRGKSVLLATNQLHVLDKVDRILVLEEGKLSEIGTYDELVAEGDAFARIMEEFHSQRGVGSRAIDSDDAQAQDSLKQDPSNQGTSKERQGTATSADGKLMEEEELDTGVVDLKVYRMYFIKVSKPKLLQKPLAGTY